jgi:uncharacterized membrane protein YeiH
MLHDNLREPRGFLIRDVLSFWKYVRSPAMSLPFQDGTGDASISIITGLFYASEFGMQFNHDVWTALTFVVGLTLRLLAIRYRWEMPKFIFDEDKRP